MSADSRSITTDALAVLGTIIDETVGRDAIHLAVEPVIAGDILTPGARIELAADRKTAVASTGNGLGIVDPFLSGVVNPGDRFLMVLHPRQIATLRHVWDHHAFSPSQGGGVDLGVSPTTRPVVTTQNRDHSVRVITKFAEENYVSYSDVVKDFMSWSDNDGEPWYVDYNTSVEHVWVALEEVLGIKLERGEIDMSCRGC